MEREKLEVDVLFVGAGPASLASALHLSRLIRLGVEHKGFALIDVLQPCVSFNHKNTYSWYRERVYKLEEESGYDPSDRVAAFVKALEWGDRIPIGLIYRKDRPTYEGQLSALREMPLVKQRLEPRQFEGLLNEFL